jgi:hypothetical protein
MAFLEKLQILISADASGAAREFNKLGDAANKDLAKASGGLDKVSGKMVSVGSAVALGGLAAVGGFAKLAMASDEADREVKKLENSIKNSDQAFANNGKALTEVAAGLQKITKADADAIVGAQSLLVQMGATEDQTKSLSPLIVDLSQKMGISLDAAAKAVGKGLNGSTGALAKMGVQVDATAAKTDAGKAVFDALAGSVGGFAQEEARSFSGQMAILKNNVGDLGEAVGKGASGVLGGLAGQAAGAAGALNELNPGILTAVGGLGTTAALAATVGGGFAAAAGQAIKMRDQLTVVGEDGSRSMTKVGKAAGAIAFVGIAIGIAETVASVANSFNDIDAKMAKAFDGARSSLGGTNEELGKAFSEMAKVEDKSAEFAGIWQGLGAEVTIGGFTHDVEEADKAFKTFLDSFGPGASQQVIDDLKAQAGQMDKTSDAYKTQMEFINKSQKMVDERSDATVKATVAEKEMNRAQQDAIKLEEERTGTIESITNGIKDYDRRVRGLKDAFAASSAAGKTFTESIENASLLDDQATAAFGMNDAYKGLFNTLNDLPKEFDIVKAALGDYTSEQNNAVGAIITFGEKAGGVLEQAIRGNQDPRLLGAIFRGRLEETLKNANIPPEQIAEYIGLAGLDEASIDLAVRISLDEKERLLFLASMQLFQQDLDDAPMKLRLAVADAIKKDEYDKANVLIQLMTGQLTPAEIAFVAGAMPDLAPYIAQLQATVYANPIKLPIITFFAPGGVLNPNGKANSTMGPGGLFAPGGLLNPGPPAGGLIPFAPSGPPTTGDGGADGNPFTPGRAMGGPVTAGQTYQVNERGREFFTPNSGGFIMNASDTQALLQGVSQLVNGKGGMTNITINETSSPRQTALEVIRANKASLFLAGAL